MSALDKAAGIIVGDRVHPMWLSGRLSQMSRMISGYRDGEESAPKRSEMRSRLDAFREAAARLREDLTDPGFVTFIGNDWADVPLSHPEVLSSLETLGNRASTLSMKMAGRGGAERAFPTERWDAISSQELCAWTVMQAMMRCRGVGTVAADNLDAWSAANELYRASGGMPLLGRLQPDGNRGEPSGWREHIHSVQGIVKEGSKRSAHLEALSRTFEAIALVPLNDDE